MPFLASIVFLSHVRLQAHLLSNTNPYTPSLSLLSSLYLDSERKSVTQISLQYFFLFPPMCFFLCDFILVFILYIPFLQSLFLNCQIHLHRYLWFLMHWNAAYFLFLSVIWSINNLTLFSSSVHPIHCLLQSTTNKFHTLAWNFPLNIFLLHETLTSHSLSLSLPLCSENLLQCVQYSSERYFLSVTFTLYLYL